MVVQLEDIDNPEEMEIVVNGPNGANRLFIYTGTAEFNFRGTGDKWAHDSLSFEVGRHFEPTQIQKAIAVASLASISNWGNAVNAGWAVDVVDACWNCESGRIRVTAQLAIRDSDGFLQRIAYEVKVLAKL